MSVNSIKEKILQKKKEITKLENSIDDEFKKVKDKFCDILEKIKKLDREDYYKIYSEFSSYLPSQENNVDDMCDILRRIYIDEVDYKNCDHLKAEDFLKDFDRFLDDGFNYDRLIKKFRNFVDDPTKKDIVDNIIQDISEFFNKEKIYIIKNCMCDHEYCPKYVKGNICVEMICKIIEDQTYCECDPYTAFGVELHECTCLPHISKLEKFLVKINKKYLKSLYKNVKQKYDEAVDENNKFNIDIIKSYKNAKNILDSYIYNDIIGKEITVNDNIFVLIDATSGMTFDNNREKTLENILSMMENDRINYRRYIENILKRYIDYIF